MLASTPSQPAGYFPVRHPRIFVSCLPLEEQLQELFAAAIEIAVADMQSGHVQHAAGLVQNEAACPLDSRCVDLGRIAAFADGVDQCELAGLFTHPSPDGRAHRIAAILGLPIFLLRVGADFDNEVLRPRRVLDDHWHGVPILQVPVARSEVGPPLGHGQNAI